MAADRARLRDRHRHWRPSGRPTRMDDRPRGDGERPAILPAADGCGSRGGGSRRSEGRLWAEIAPRHAIAFAPGVHDERELQRRGTARRTRPARLRDSRASEAKVYAENTRAASARIVRDLLVRESLASGVPCSETAFVAVRSEPGQAVTETRDRRQRACRKAGRTASREGGSHARCFQISGHSRRRVDRFGRFMSDGIP